MNIIFFIFIDLLIDPNSTPTSLGMGFFMGVCIVLALNNIILFFVYVHFVNLSVSLYTIIYFICCHWRFRKHEINC